ncbi:MAG: hypothetical protein ACP5GA_10675, partial [Acidithiobacillus sp.]
MKTKHSVGFSFQSSPQKKDQTILFPSHHVRPNSFLFLLFLQQETNAMTGIIISFLYKIRRAAAIISALFLLAAVAVAFADEATTPLAIMQKITNQVIHILQANQGHQLSTPEQEHIEKVIVPYVDFTL